MFNMVARIGGGRHFLVKPLVHYKCVFKNLFKKKKDRFSFLALSKLRMSVFGPDCSLYVNSMNAVQLMHSLFLCSLSPVTLR